MQCVYELEAVCTCPVDGKPDYYKLTIRTTRIVMVEDILKHVSEFADKKITQEVLTTNLHRALACDVTSVGWHSGVRVTVRCGGPS